MIPSTFPRDVALTLSQLVAEYDLTVARLPPEAPAAAEPPSIMKARRLVGVWAEHQQSIDKVRKSMGPTLLARLRTFTGGHDLIGASQSGPPMADDHALIKFGLLRYIVDAGGGGWRVHITTEGQEIAGV